MSTLFRDNGATKSGHPRRVMARKAKRSHRRGAPAEYDEEARREARQQRMAEARRGACHSLARQFMRGPNRNYVLGEIWQLLKHSQDMLDWQFCGWIADALDSDYPEDIVLVALDLFHTCGWLKMRTTNRTGAREYRLAPNYAAEARKYIDLTGDFGLDIAGVYDA